ncbi:MAG TPA: M3 family metallopeptidase [Longimicrobiales bacterium]
MVLIRARISGPAASVALLLGFICTGTAASAQAPDSRPFYPAGLDAPKLARLVDEHLAAGRAAIEQLAAVTGTRTATNTLRPYDDAQNHAFQAGGLARLAAHVHPDSAIRAEGVRALERVTEFQTGLNGDRRVVEAISALDTTALTAQELRVVAALRRDFRRAGHNLDESARARLRELRATTSRLGTLFGRNIAEDTTTIPATNAELEGMPPDWIAAHPRDAQGRVLLSTKYPDFFPVIGYAANRPLRQRMAVAFANRGWPANVAVLDSLLHAREAIARLLGYPDWVSYQAETRMVGSADTIRAFLERVHQAANPALERLAAEYLARLRQDDPGAASVDVADHGYLAELIRRERYALDGREVRAYFPVDAVKDGMLNVMSQMFGLDFRRADVPVWHPDVEAYEAWEGDRLLGRFYLDLYPRPAKYSHAAVMALRPGLPGRQTAEVMLVTNFPRAEDGAPGLMGHTEQGSGVTTFFHEFGHVLHVLFIEQPYLAADWEHDFNEAPSQMLEELAWHPAVLQRVTRHVETGAPIPAALVARMRAADAFDRPTQAAMQLAFSAVSLGLHDRPAAHANPDSLMNAAFSSYLSVTPADYHFVTSIDHLGMGDYSATMYTYLWSQVISKDLWSAFDPADPLNPGPARRYRDAILRPGGTRPAAELLKDFLGRPFAFASWRRWLEGR